MAALPLGAQGSHTRASIVIGPTWLDFASGWGGDFGAGAAQVRLARHFVEVSLLAVVPTGAAAAIPDCVPGGTCVERKTPDMLVGATASVLAAIGQRGLRGSVGLGAIKAINMKGPGSSSSVAGMLGLEWMSRRAAGLTPTLGVRAMLLGSSIAGMRQLLLPAVGLVF